MNLDVFQISPLHKFFLALVFNIRFEPDCDLSKEKMDTPTAANTLMSFHVKR